MVSTRAFKLEHARSSIYDGAGILHKIILKNAQTFKNLKASGWRPLDVPQS